MVGEELLVKIKETIVSIRPSGAVISRKMIISIGKSMLKANDLSSHSEFGGGITLKDNWPRGTLKSMDRVKQKETIGKVEPSAQFLAEENSPFKEQYRQGSITMTSLIIVSSTLIRHLFHTYPLESTHSTLKVLKTFA